MKSEEHEGDSWGVWVEPKAIGQGPIDAEVGWYTFADGFKTTTRDRAEIRAQNLNESKPHARWKFEARPFKELLDGESASERSPIAPKLDEHGHFLPGELEGMGRGDLIAFLKIERAHLLALEQMCSTRLVPHDPVVLLQGLTAIGQQSPDEWSRETAKKTMEAAELMGTPKGEERAKLSFEALVVRALTR